MEIVSHVISSTTLICNNIFNNNEHVKSIVQQETFPLTSILFKCHSHKFKFSPCRDYILHSGIEMFPEMASYYFLSYCDKQHYRKSNNCFRESMKLVQINQVMFFLQSGEKKTKKSHS